ncbi:DNA-binding protein [Burkholderia pyrrocinia]|uniref:DNA-binding protein n=1 Tax=Burkholderia pyrrocinia TaxID=60550 RepID=A0ABZ3BDD4_BURPY
MSAKSDDDLVVNFDEWLRSRIAALQPIDRSDRTAMCVQGRELSIAILAVQLYAERHPRPLQVTQLQVAEMLGISRWTVSKMVKGGQLKLNRCGLIPIEQIDRAIASD